MLLVIDRLMLVGCTDWYTRAVEAQSWCLLATHQESGTDQRQQLRF